MNLMALGISKNPPIIWTGTIPPVVPTTFEVVAVGTKPQRMGGERIDLVVNRNPNLIEVHSSKEESTIS